LLKDRQTISVKLGNWMEAKASGTFAVTVVLILAIAIIVLALPVTH
jgi:hypothetical protein